MTDRNRSTRSRALFYRVFHAEPVSASAENALIDAFSILRPPNAADNLAAAILRAGPAAVETFWSALPRKAQDGAPLLRRDGDALPVNRLKVGRSPTPAPPPR